MFYISTQNTSIELVKFEWQLARDFIETSLFLKELLLKSKTSYALLSKLLQVPLIPTTVTNVDVPFSY